MLLDILQIIVAVLLIIIVLLQNRGAGAGATFGGDSNIYKTKRGAEKTLFTSTIILAITFLVISIVNSIF